MRVAFVAHYPARELLSNDFLNPKHAGREHDVPWVRALATCLANNPDLRVRIFSLQRSVRSHAVVRTKGYEVEFLPQRWPARFDPWLAYWINTRYLRVPIERYRPHVVCGFGFELGDATVASRLSLPCCGFVQGIARDYLRFSRGRHLETLLWLSREIVGIKRLGMVIVESVYAQKRLSSPSSADKIIVIPHPVDPMFACAAPGNPAANPAVFVTLGTVSWQKGVDYVINVAQELRSKAAFVIVGDGPEFDRYRKLGSELGPGVSIHFTGRLSRPDVIQQLSRARALIHPSRVENSPNAITEAQVMGLPVVAWRIGGIPELVGHSVDGYLLEPGDVAGLVQVVKFLTDNPSQAAEMGRRARASALDRHDAERIAMAFLNCIRRLLEGRLLSHP